MQEIERRIAQSSLPPLQAERVRDAIQLLDDVQELGLAWLLDSKWQPHKEKSIDDIKLRVATKLIAQFKTGSAGLKS